MSSVVHRLVIRGRVQGVGFRHALAVEARLLGLCGWVRNCRDGTVEAIVAGPAQHVAAIVAWSRRGPAAACVTAVDVDAATGTFNGFDIAPTI